MMSMACFLLRAVRPLGKGRGERGEKLTVYADTRKISVASKSARGSEDSQSFDFDSISDKDDNRQLFEKIGRPLVDSVCEGYNGTLFAYGQTGSGKSELGSKDPIEPTAYDDSSIYRARS